AGAASPREAVSLTPALSSAAAAACQKRGSELSCSSSVSQAVAGGAAPLSIHELRSVVLPVPGGAASSVSLRVATAEERLSNRRVRATVRHLPPRTGASLASGMHACPGTRPGRVPVASALGGPSFMATGTFAPRRGACNDARPCLWVCADRLRGVVHTPADASRAIVTRNG